MMDSFRHGSNRGSGEARVNTATPGVELRRVHGSNGGRQTGIQTTEADRTSRRYSVTALYSIVAERDEEVSDELSD
ncbi:hypothetical protein IWW50_001641, partial [Coemansia erecta]